MKSRSVVLPYLLSPKAIEVGNVVANPQHPTQGRYESKEIEISEEAGNLIIMPGSSYKDLRHHDRGAGLSVLISHIFQTTLDADARRDRTLETKKVLTYGLDRSDDVFASLCEDVEFQVWLEKTVKKQDAYFVVGYQTLVDSTFDIGKETKAQLEAAASTPSDQTGVKAEAKVSARDAGKSGTAFTADNEQVYAVQYRKILFEAFRPKDTDHAHLSTSQTWVSTLKTRGTESDQQASVKATLTDEDLWNDCQEIWATDEQSIYAFPSTLESLGAA